MSIATDPFIKKLDEKELTNLLMVLQEIKDELVKNKTSDNVARLRPYLRFGNPHSNKYFEAIVEYSYIWIDEEDAEEVIYDTEGFEKARARFLTWLLLKRTLEEYETKYKVEEDPVGLGVKIKVIDHYELRVNLASFNELYEGLVQTANSVLKTNAIKLSFTQITVPTFEIGGIKYKFKTGMQLKLPYYIISYCLDNCPNKEINLDDLRKAMKAKNIPTEGMTNLEQVFKNTNFGKGKPLDLFADIYTHGLKVKDLAYATDTRTEKIIAASNKI